jgi:uncharacterized protein YecT (DUF1311 family)
LTNVSGKSKTLVCQRDPATLPTDEIREETMRKQVSHWPLLALAFLSAPCASLAQDTMGGSLVKDMANVSVALDFYAANCQNIISSVTVGMQDSRRIAEAKGIGAVGVQVWDIEYDIAKQGMGAVYGNRPKVVTCAVMHGYIMENSIDGGLAGPSFDCAKAGTQSEKAICLRSWLWGYDVALARFYSEIGGSIGQDSKAALDLDQRAWLKERDRCLADDAFIAQSYEGRMEDLASRF